MKLSTAIALAFSSVVSAKNILLTNDDGWLATGIRAAYRELSAAGHNVYLVAPAEQRSGYGGTFRYNKDKTLEANDEFNYKKQGDPAWGHEDSDDHIWYFDATPAACVAFAFDYLLPTHFAGVEIDLVVSGPNQGTNPETFFTLSGTIGATYNAVYRGYPAVAFSGSDPINTFYKHTLNTLANDPQNIYAKKIVELVDTLFANQKENERLLPLGTGLNVNFPLVGFESVVGCDDPKYTFTRLTGPTAVALAVKYSDLTQTFLPSITTAPGANVYYNGDSSLPSEGEVLAIHLCNAPVSVFSVDYTAATGPQEEVKGKLSSILYGLDE